jgi:hypothetical protein
MKVALAKPAPLFPEMDTVMDAVRNRHEPVDP